MIFDRTKKFNIGSKKLNTGSKKVNIGSILFILGCCCFIAAAAFGMYNSRLDRQAGAAAAELSERLSPLMASAAAVELLPDADLSVEAANAREAEEMETLLVDGYSICAGVSIPKIGIDLPVINDWSAENLKISVCRYYGLPRAKLVLMAHNYARHFGKIGSLRAGDVVQITDIRGRVFDHEVTMTETIPGQQFEQLMDGGGEWDLTLFTCTYGGANRVVVRCVLCD
jgi:sortase A